MSNAVRLQPSLMKRPWSEATAGCSMAAEHVLSMLLDFRRAGVPVVVVDQLFAYARAGGNAWSEPQLREYLEQLRRNDCLTWVDIVD